MHSSTPCILHRDLKTKNVLVDKLVSHAVLCDFGEGRISEVGHTGTAGNPRTAVGTARSMAPEVMKREQYTKAADVYSFGIVAYVEVITPSRCWNSSLCFSSEDRFRTVLWLFVRSLFFRFGIPRPYSPSADFRVRGFVFTYFCQVGNVDRVSAVPGSS